MYHTVITDISEHSFPVQSQFIKNITSTLKHLNKNEKRSNFIEYGQ